MMSNRDRYKKDLESLIATGQQLEISIQAECYPERVKSQVKKKFGAEAEEVIAALPPFATTYQRWYSEAKALIRQLLPDRLADFVRYYEKPKTRKAITFESYRIEDFLQGLSVTRGWEKKEGRGAGSRDSALSAATCDSRFGASTL